MKDVIVLAGKILLAIFIIGLIVSALNPEVSSLFGRMATHIRGVAP